MDNQLNVPLSSAATQH